MEVADIVLEQKVTVHLDLNPNTFLLCRNPYYKTEQELLYEQLKQKRKEELDNEDFLNFLAITQDKKRKEEEKVKIQTRRQSKIF